MTYDVIVVGLGGVGSAAAAALARRGQRVLGLDRYPAVHDQGASAGESRIVRKAYFEGAGYVPLLHRAYELWDELGLLTRTGALFLGAETSRVLGGTLATARQWDLPYEMLDAAEVSRRFPAFTPPAGTAGLLEQDAGWVSPEAAVGGPIALIRTGDVVRIDIPNRRIDVDADLESRRPGWTPPQRKYTKGVFGKYATGVSSAADGAVWL